MEAKELLIQLNSEKADAFFEKMYGVDGIAENKERYSFLSAICCYFHELFMHSAIDTIFTRVFMCILYNSYF